jgi:beta-galactosidase
MAHILPHWNWPDRVGQITPVHVFTSGDEAELFLNGRSLGRKRKGEYEYRLRWDDVVYEPGELKAVAFKDASEWATEVVRTTGVAAALAAEVDRTTVLGNGEDLVFVTVRVTDREGLTVPVANNTIRFSIHGPADIVATDNGDPTDFTPFPSHERAAFSGLCLAIIRTRPGESGTITVRADSGSLRPATVSIQSVVDR